MLTNPIDAMRYENAKFAREVEYLKEIALDDEIGDRVEVAESQYTGESVEELEEALTMVNRMPSDVDMIEEAAEINRILKADENLTFEEMARI